ALILAVVITALVPFLDQALLRLMSMSKPDSSINIQFLVKSMSVFIHSCTHFILSSILTRPGSQRGDFQREIAFVFHKLISFRPLNIKSFKGFCQIFYGISCNNRRAFIKK
ncbi:hypothetical protein BDF21DRAFT_339439, partial [Thamnidium elegans]